MKNKDIIGIVTLLLVSVLVIGCIESNNKEAINESVTVVETTIEPTATTGVIGESATVVETVAEPIETVGPNTTVEPTVTIRPNIVVDRQNNVDQYGSLTYTFSVNDEKMMLGRNVQLTSLATEEGTAAIKVDGDQYNLTYNIGQDIKSRVIKAVNFDGNNQTVDIMVTR